MSVRWFARVTPIACLLVSHDPARRGAAGAGRTPNGGPMGRFSATGVTLRSIQINADNFNKLEIAWRFKTDNLGPRPEFQLEATPLMINGRDLFHRWLRGDR